MVSKYGKMSQHMIFSMSGMVIGGLMLAFSNENNKTIAYIGIIIYSLTQLSFFSAGFASLYILSPVNKISLINSINAAVYLFAGMLGTLLFGFFADLTNNNWDASFALIAMGSIIGMSLAIIVHCYDTKHNGVLHK